MKKLMYYIIPVVMISFFACGGSPAEQATDETMENHESHDHEAMMKEAEANDMIPAAEGAKVFFVNLKDGDLVTTPVKIIMGVEGMTVHPAGEIIEGTGHHHIILNSPGVPLGESVPADENHIHYGGGQTEVELPLPLGHHILMLQFADGLHRSYGEQMTATVSIDVR